MVSSTAAAQPANWTSAPNGELQGKQVPYLDNGDPAIVTWRAAMTTALPTLPTVIPLILSYDHDLIVDLFLRTLAARYRVTIEDKTVQDHIGLMNEFFFNTITWLDLSGTNERKRQFYFVDKTPKDDRRLPDNQLRQLHHKTSNLFWSYLGRCMPQLREVTTVAHFLLSDGSAEPEASFHCVSTTIESHGKIKDKRYLYPSPGECNQIALEIVLGPPPQKQNQNAAHALAAPMASLSLNS